MRHLGRLRTQEPRESREGGNDALETQAGGEVDRLQKNLRGLNRILKTRRGKGELREDLDKKDIGRLALKARIMIGGIATLIAIPVVAEVFGPNVITQFNDAAKHFFMEEHFPETFAALSAVTAAVMAIVFWPDIREYFMGKKKGKSSS